MFRRLLILTYLATLPTTAAAQISQEQADKFVQFLGSTSYTKLIARRALASDATIPPRCPTRRIADREIVAVTQTPRFVAAREMPVEGKWVERITVERCGRPVAHNIFVDASKESGLRAAAGLPGTSLTDIELQHAAGRTVLRRALAQVPKSCKRGEIVDTKVLDKRVSPGQRWREAWTVWACGRRITRQLAFRPKADGGVGFELR